MTDDDFAEWLQERAGQDPDVTLGELGDAWALLVLAEAFAVSAPADSTPYTTAGSLTAATVRAAMDEMRAQRWPGPPAGYAGGREPFGAVPMPPRHYPEWTVEAGGYRLVIEDGAMAGLVRVDEEEHQ